MTISVRVAGSCARSALAGALFLACVAAPVAAQQGQPLNAPLNLSAAANAAAVTAAAESAALAPAAQDDAAKQDSATLNFFRSTELSGFVDLYYGYNFNTPKTACGSAGGVEIFTCLHNFDVAHNSFSLNLAEIAVEKKPTADSRGGFRIDLDYGPTAAMVAYNEPSIFQNIQQAYVSYLAPTGSGLQFDFGKFVTPTGNEVIETKDNWNYSRSLLFALAIPYYHMGMRAAYGVNSKVSLTGFLLNGWDDAIDNNGGKTIGANVTFKPTPAFTIIENYLGGPEQAGNNSDWRHLSDTVVSYTANSKISLAANYDYGQDSVAGTTMKWQGIAAYLKYQANDWFALTPRFDYFNDHDGYRTGTAQSVNEFTLTTEFKHKDGVLMRIEYRGDFSDESYFIKNTDQTSKSQNSLTIGFVYAFTTKAP